MRRLIWILAGRTCPKVRFLMWTLILQKPCNHVTRSAIKYVLNHPDANLFIIFSNPSSDVDFGGHWFFSRLPAHNLYGQYIQNTHAVRRNTHTQTHTRTHTVYVHAEHDKLYSSSGMYQYIQTFVFFVRIFINLQKIIKVTRTKH